MVTDWLHHVLAPVGESDTELWLRARRLASAVAPVAFDAVARVSPQHPTPQMVQLVGVVAEARRRGVGLPLNAVGPGLSLDFDPGPGPVARITAASAGPASVSTCDGWPVEEYDCDLSDEVYEVEAEEIVSDSGSESEATVDGDVLWVQVSPDPPDIPVISIGTVSNLADGVEEERVEARVEEERDAWRRMRLVAP